MNVRHLLEITDLSADEVRAVLDLAARPPESLGRPLDGEGAALIFEKPSARTRLTCMDRRDPPPQTRGRC